MPPLIAQGDAVAVPEVQFLFQGQRRDDLDHVAPVSCPGKSLGLGQYRRGSLAVHGQRQRPGGAEFRRRRGYLNALLRSHLPQRIEGRRVSAQVQGTGKRREAQFVPALPADPVQAGEVSTLAQAGEDRTAETDLLCNFPNSRAYYITARGYLLAPVSTFL